MTARGDRHPLSRSAEAFGGLSALPQVEVSILGGRAHDAERPAPGPLPPMGPWRGLSYGGGTERHTTGGREAPQYFQSSERPAEPFVRAFGGRRRHWIAQQRTAQVVPPSAADRIVVRVPSETWSDGRRVFRFQPARSVQFSTGVDKLLVIDASKDAEPASLLKRHVHSLRSAQETMASGERNSTAGSAWRCTSLHSVSSRRYTVVVLSATTTTSSRPPTRPRMRSILQPEPQVAVVV